MKKFVVLLVLLCGLMIPAAVSATATVRGVVVYFNESSKKVIIETDNGFTCGQSTFFTGFFTLATGDEVVGSFESYGFQEIYNFTKDTKFYIQVEEYWLDAQSAFEWLEN